MNQYEAMFLVDPTFGSSFENCEAEIRRLMERAEAEIIFCRKWDERRLAYRIKGRKRGIYALVYFKAPPDNIKGLERDALLSENILRVLVLRADDLTPETMEKIASGYREPRSVEDAEAGKVTGAVKAAEEKESAKTAEEKESAKTAEEKETAEQPGDNQVKVAAPETGETAGPDAEATTETESTKVD